MNKYIFERGHVIAPDTISAEEIKEHEEKMGELLGVMRDERFIPVVRDRVIKVSYKGETHTLKEWAEITGINEKTLHSRYAKGERDYILFREVGV